MKKLTGKVAVVTGASKGIGAAIALHMASEGASIVVNYSSSKEGAERVVQKIKDLQGKAIAVKADLSVEQDIEHLFNEAKKAFGHVDILVNNAGIYEFLPLEEISSEHFHKQFNLNVLGLLLSTQIAVRHFNPKGGSIINISSAITNAKPANSAVYSGTKAAVNAITSVLAKELAPKGIRVNSINPGMIETEGVISGGHSEGEFREWIESVTPLQRIAQVHEVAPMATFLASEDASYITGECHYISGGF